jgi:hypothetical protein
LLEKAIEHLCEISQLTSTNPKSKNHLKHSFWQEYLTGLVEDLQALVKNKTITFSKTERTVAQDSISITAGTAPETSLFKSIKSYVKKFFEDHNLSKDNVTDFLVAYCATAMNSISPDKETVEVQDRVNLHQNIKRIFDISTELRQKNPNLQEESLQKELDSRSFVELENIKHIFSAINSRTPDNNKEKGFKFKAALNDIVKNIIDHTVKNDGILQSDLIKLSDISAIHETTDRSSRHLLTNAEFLHISQETLRIIQAVKPTNGTTAFGGNHVSKVTSRKDLHAEIEM